MATKRCGAYKFQVFSNDHRPAHVHVDADDGQVVVALGSNADEPYVDEIRGDVRNKSVKKILETAIDHWDELIKLWESVHGKDE